jgi:hypothetical protein
MGSIVPVRPFRCRDMLDRIGFMGDKILPYVIDESIDIHHEIDLYIAKEWIKENYTD